MPERSFEAIMKDLKKGSYAPVYVLHGEESFFIDRITSFIEENALGESERVFNQLIAYGKDTDPGAIIDNARQYPMMAQRRVVIIKEAQSLRDVNALEPYLMKPSDSTILVLCFMHKSLDGRKSFAKSAKKHAVMFHSKRLYDNKIPSWIEAHVERRNFRIDPVASMALVEYLGNDLSKITNELDKLMVHIGEEKHISEEDVFDNIGISKDFNVFELQKALGQRDITKLERIVQYFIANMRSHPLVLITANLFSYFSRLLITRSLGRATNKELMSALGLRSAYFLNEYKSAAANYSVADLERIIAVIRKYDLESKGVGHRSKSDAQVFRDLIQEIFYIRSVPEKLVR